VFTDSLMTYSFLESDSEIITGPASTWWIPRVCGPNLVPRLQHSLAASMRVSEQSLIGFSHHALLYFGPV